MSLLGCIDLKTLRQLGRPSDDPRSGKAAFEDYGLEHVLVSLRVSLSKAKVISSIELICASDEAIFVWCANCG